MKRLALIVILAGASGASPAAAAADPLLQLFEKRCAVCHKEDETPTLHGGISLDNLRKSTDDVKAIIERVKLPAESKKRMPQSKGKPGDKKYLPPLTKDEIALIEKLGKPASGGAPKQPGRKNEAESGDNNAGTVVAKTDVTEATGEDSTEAAKAEPAKDPKEAVKEAAAALPADVNKNCPIMTTETVDPDLNVEYAGKTVYFCCPKCQRLWGTHANYVIKARGTDALPQFKGMEEELGLEAISLLPQRFCPVEKGALILPGCPTVTYKGEKVYVFEKDDVKTWNKDPDKHAKLAVADGVLPQLKGKVEVASASAAAADATPSAAPAAAGGSQVTTSESGELAKSVLKLFEARCAACHGQNATEPKKFRVIDVLDKLRDSNLVNLQVPEDSKIYSVLKDGEMPYLTKAEKQAGKKAPDPVSDEDVATVLSWIRAGAPTADGVAVVANKTEEKPVEQQTPKRALVTPADEMTAAMADLQSVLREDQTDTRYVSISVAHNHAGVTDDQLENLRRGARKMFNSLSTGPRIATFPEVGPQKTLLRVRLTDIGWDAKQWDHVAAHFPHAIDTGVTAALGAACKATVPILRADWMAATATRPPLYHDILKLPKTQKELEKQLEVKVADNLKRGQAIRAGISKSGVSLANRLVERHDLGRGGSYWLSYDFKSSGGRSSLLQFPLGPKTFPDGSAALLGGKLAFEHAGGEMVFTLPNGLHGYYVADTLGNRLDGAAPTNIVSDRDNVTGRVEVSNGLSCIMCHDKGLKDGFSKDEVRSIAATFGSEEQRMIERLHVEPADFAARLAKDMASFAAALKEARAEPMAGQREAVGQFARLYEDEVTLEQAAAEIGLSPAVLMEKMENVPSLTDLRITFRGKGSLQREHFNDRFPELVQRLTNDTVKDAKDLVTVGSSKLENLTAVPILLTLDKTTYKEGDIPKIDLEASEDCHVRLLYQDARGDITILFPNQFIESDKVSKGKARLLPAPNPKKAGDEVAIEIFGGDDGKTFGTERLVAIATDQSFTDNAKLLAAARAAFDKDKVPFATHDSKSLDLAVTKAARAITRQSTTAGTSKVDKTDSARTGFSTVTITTKAK